MDEINAKQRRERLALCDRISELATEAEAIDPAIKRELYRIAGSFRRHYGFADTEKLEMLMAALQAGAATAGDVIRETGFPAATVHWGLKLLETNGICRVERFSDGGPGRPTLMYRMIGNDEYELNT